MTVYINDILLDSPIDKIIADATHVHLFDTFSVTYATILATSFGNYTPVISKADNDGAGSGRKGVLAAQSNVAITGNVTFNQFAIVDSVNSVVLYVGEGTTKALTDGDLVTIPVSALRVLDAVVTP